MVVTPDGLDETGKPLGGLAFLFFVALLFLLFAVPGHEKDKAAGIFVQGCGATAPAARFVLAS